MVHRSNGFPRVSILDFSVLIPAHCAATFLPHALESVRAQTEQSWEALVYEDGRFDDTAAVVERFAQELPGRVRLLGGQERGGVSCARNALLAEARGRFIAFLDADDVWEPEHLATARAVLEAGADFCASAALVIDAAGRPGSPVRDPDAADLARPAEALWRANFIVCTSMICARRTALDGLEWFDPALTHGEDLDLWLRLLAAGRRFVFTGVRTCRYRKHPAGAMADPVRVAERTVDFFVKHQDFRLVSRAQRRTALAASLLALGRLTWRVEPMRARRAFTRLCAVEPWNPLHAARWAATWLPARNRQD